MGTTHPDVRTLYAYTAQNDEELSFEPGHVFQILEKTDDSWWMAHDITTTPPTSGYVPSNYVEEIVDDNDGQADQDQKQQYQENQNDNNEAAYMVPDDLFNNENEDVTVIVNGETGKGGGFYVWTKFPYQATRPDELSFEANMLLEVLDTSGEFKDWWMAKNKQGDTGLIPGNYVKRIASPCTTPASTDSKVEAFTFSTENRQTESGDGGKKENEKVKQWKKHKAGLLVQRLNPFPSKKAEEAKASPGVEVIKEKLKTSGLDENEDKTDGDSVSYRQEPYYFGKINRMESEKKLQKFKDGSYLIRDSESTVRATFYNNIIIIIFLFNCA